MGVFDRIFAALATEGGPLLRLTIDATHLKAHRTAASLLKQGAFPRCIGRSKGGLNATLHAVCDGQGRPMILLLTEGQASDHRGAALMLPKLPPRKFRSQTADTTAPASGPPALSAASPPGSPQRACASTPSRKT
jgi:transposase